MRPLKVKKERKKEGKREKKREEDRRREEERLKGINSIAINQAICAMQMLLCDCTSGLIFFEHHPNEDDINPLPVKYLYYASFG